MPTFFQRRCYGFSLCDVKIYVNSCDKISTEAYWVARETKSRGMVSTAVKWNGFDGYKWTGEMDSFHGELTETLQKSAFVMQNQKKLKLYTIFSSFSFFIRNFMEMKSICFKRLCDICFNASLESVCSIFYFQDNVLIQLSLVFEILLNKLDVIVHVSYPIINDVSLMSTCLLKLMLSAKWEKKSGAIDVKWIRIATVYSCIYALQNAFPFENME